MAVTAEENPTTNDDLEAAMRMASVGNGSSDDGEVPSETPDKQPQTERAAEAPQSAGISDWERTPEGYLELEQELRDIRRALNMDFQHHAVHLSHSDLIRLATPRIEALNKQRTEARLAEMSLEQAGVKEPKTDQHLVSEHSSEVEPIDPTTVNDKLLYHLASTSWHELVPRDDSPEARHNWESFVSQLPEQIQINLEWYREVESKVDALKEDHELQDKVHEIRTDRMEVLQTATRFLSVERHLEEITARVAGIYRGAGYSNRPLTKAESRHIDRLRAQQQDLRDNKNEILQSSDKLSEVESEIKRLINIRRRRDFEEGIVVTDQMKSVIDELLPSLAQGQPALFVGETGGAKTALAEFISRRYLKEEPEFIAGYGDVNSYQAVGKTGLVQAESGLTWADIENILQEEGTEWDKLSPETRAQLRMAGLQLVTSAGSSSVTEFVPGPVIRAMERGAPLILDEVNAMSPEFLKRFNRIMQMRPGDTLTVQEDSGREVTVRSGFVIIATANEKSKRYKGVEDLSVEFQNRFGANIIRIPYPDNDLPFGEQPTENLTIAVTALTDREGNYDSDIPPADLIMFVRACHVSQQVFSGNFGEGFENYVSPDRRRGNKPGLEETVLAPRTMVDLLQKVRSSHGQVTLEQALRSYVGGIKNPDDRAQMITILQNHGFLKQEDDESGPYSPQPGAI